MDSGSVRNDRYCKGICKTLHYVNIMAQYRPCGEAYQYKELNRRPTSLEYFKAVDMARRLGLQRGFRVHTPLF